VVALEYKNPVAPRLPGNNQKQYSKGQDQVPFNQFGFPIIRRMFIHSMQTRTPLQHVGMGEDNGWRLWC
jgi:hypothetical protein